MEENLIDRECRPNRDLASSGPGFSRPGTDGPDPASGAVTPTGWLRGCVRIAIRFADHTATLGRGQLDPEVPAITTCP